MSLFWYGFKILFDVVSDFTIVKVLFYKGLQRLFSCVEDIKESFRAGLTSSEAFNLYLFICDVNDVFMGIWGKERYVYSIKGDLFLTKVLENFIGIFERGDLGKFEVVWEGWWEGSRKSEGWNKGERCGILSEEVVVIGRWVEVLLFKNCLQI